MAAEQGARGACPLSAGTGSKDVQLIVIGCGTIGLPLAIAFAERGFEVLGIDIDRSRVAALSDATAAGCDAEVAEGLKAAIGEGRIAFAESLPPAVGRRAFILAVPTPVDATNRPVLLDVEDAFRTAAAEAREGDLIIIRSTVPIGTTRPLARRAQPCRPASRPQCHRRL
jgi:UDP-N-acetyl-D-mannosaminuronic acid dehydrogenase